jgi:hypothetical protein
MCWHRGFLTWWYHQTIHFCWDIFHYKTSSYWGTSILGHPQLQDGAPQFFCWFINPISIHYLVRYIYHKP